MKEKEVEELVYSAIKDSITIEAHNYYNKTGSLREDVASGSFNGNRNVMQQGGYPVSPTPKQYYYYYERLHIAKRIVDIMPDFTWSDAPIVTEEGEKESSWQKSFESIAKETNLFSYINRVDKASRLSRFRHYTNLNKTEVKLSSFIKAFKEHTFITCHEYLQLPRMHGSRLLNPAAMSYERNRPDKSSPLSHRLFHPITRYS